MSYLFKQYKIKGETYNVYLQDIISWIDDEKRVLMIVETPANALGYNDYIHFNNRNGNLYGLTSYRYLQPYIMRKFEKVLLKFIEDLKKGKHKNICDHFKMSAESIIERMF